MPVKSIAVLASGGGTNFQAIIDAVASGQINGRITALIYNRKAACAAERARQTGIPAVYINRKTSPSDEAFLGHVHGRLIDSGADVVILAGWLEILGPATVNHFRNRIINTHPALIPAFCGKGMYGHHVHEAVLQYGAKVSGCTIHFVEEGVDTGPIIFQQAVDVLPGDTAETLSARILPHEHRLLVEAVKLLCDNKIAVEGRKVKIID